MTYLAEVGENANCIPGKVYCFFKSSVWYI